MISSIVREFFNDIDSPWSMDFKTQEIPKFNTDGELVNWIIHHSGWPYLPLVLPGAPFADMLREAQGLEDLFVMHRTTPGENPEYANQGWKSICLHGEAWDKTGHWEAYEDNKGKKFEDIVYRWCDEITERCPETTRYFREVFPEHRFHRLRYMWLDPDGYIQPHRDREQHFLGPINVALNNPKGCEFKMEGKGYVPFKDSGNACLVDIGNLHSVWNRSNTPRIHMISHGGAREPFNQIVLDSLKQALV
jgi:hypothetical protein